MKALEQESEALNRQLVELKNENWLLRETVQQLKNLEQNSRTDEKQIVNATPPDYQSVRDHTLNKLKMGQQSAAGKAINAFIRELEKL